MRLRACLVVILAILASLAALWAAAAEEEAADLAAIDAFVETSMRRLGIPGVAIAIVRDGKTIHARGYGRDGNGTPMSETTPVYIGSISKSFTALAILQLADDGLVDLDAPLRDVLPGFHVAGADHETITIEHLLSHTSGLSDTRYLETTRLSDRASIEEAVRDLRAAEPVAAPGTAFHYFNPNYVVLGRVIEVASGRSYADYLRDRVLDPLGMVRTFTHPDRAREAGLAQGHALTFGFPLPRSQPHRTYALPAGYLMSTAEDMASYLRVLLDDGRSGDERILSRASMLSLHAPDRVAGFYAKGWFVGEHHGHRLIQHGGTNEFFKAEAMLLPDDGIGVVMLANQSSLPAALFGYPHLAAGVLDLLVGVEPSSHGAPLRLAGYLLAIAFALQLAWLARSFVRLPGWHARTRGTPAWRTTVDLVTHLVAIPAIALGIAALVEFGLGRGVSLRQAFAGVPDLAIMLLVAYLADLGLAVGKASALVRARRGTTRSDDVGTDPSRRASR